MAKYDENLKEQILAMIASGREPGELAKEYGISRTAINNWRRSSEDPKVKPKISAENAEIKALKAQIKRLEMERDVLKKAMAIMSSS